MLAATTISSVTEKTLCYWREEVKKPEILGIAKGKEIGHKLADLVDEKTTALLTLNYLTRHQTGKTGDRRSRSMGDLWLQDAAIYHPVNVKTGIVGSEGQPNLVSLKKLLGGIMARQIDSYYLLIVKMEIRPAAITPSVCFIDILDWLDYVTFDSGPGQMMLKAVKFFREYPTARPKSVDIMEKVKRLMDLYEDGERRLKENRDHDLQEYRKTFEIFQSSGKFVVTPQTQQSLNLQ